MLPRAEFMSKDIGGKLPTQYTNAAAIRTVTITAVKTGSSIDEALWFLVAATQRLTSNRVDVISFSTSRRDMQYDVIICSHVIEHVDDRAALNELYRVTKPGGRVLLMTPMVEGWEATFEDRSKATEQERWLYFGQGDHLRFYGSDFRHRIMAAGFELEEFTAVEPEVSKHGLVRGEKVFIARRPI
jgi:SAM-dependent methyltransferase